MRRLRLQLAPPVLIYIKMVAETNHILADASFTEICQFCLLGKWFMLKIILNQKILKARFNFQDKAT